MITTAKDRQYWNMGLKKQSYNGLSSLEGHFRDVLDDFAALEAENALERKMRSDFAATYEFCQKERDELLARETKLIPALDATANGIRTVANQLDHVLTRQLAGGGIAAVINGLTVQADALRIAAHSIEMASAFITARCNALPILIDREAGK